MPHYDSAFGTVEYDRNCDAVIGRLTEFTQGEEFREYMNAIIDAVEEHDSNKVLADSSQFEDALTKEDQGWSVTEWSPRAEAAGVDHIAMVMPEAVVAKMSIDSVVEMADDTLNRDLFDDVDEAKDWLRQQD